MNNVTQYTRALHAVVTNAQFSRSDLLKNLRAALQRRGHEKLLPRIYSEYKKLVLAEHRHEKTVTVTPEAEKTRILLELYRKLTHATAEPENTK